MKGVDISMRKLSNSLSEFMMNTESSQFDDPYNDNIEEDSGFTINTVIERSKELKQEKKKSKKVDKYSEIIKKGDDLLNQYLDDDIIDDFDGYLGNFLLDDEDTELKNNLIRYGRKYARDNKVSEGSSEISKAYSESEKLLSELLKEINGDKEQVQKDISNMRMMRTRNYKTLSDLIESKATFHNTALSVIKEMNAMKKNQFELQMKVDKSKKEEEQDDSTANKAIQSLFSIGRDNIMVGGSGYADISGSSDAGVETVSSYSDSINEDEIIQKTYFNNDDVEESDGDKFLKYEGMGAHYILLYDDTGYREIIVEDNEGNIIPDYPLPGDPNELDFEISESTGTATDNLANQYEIRKA